MMDKVKGSNCYETLDAALTEDVASEGHVRAMARNWAQLSVKLASRTYEAIGSPDLDEAGNIVIGNLLDGGWPDVPNYPYFAGPFKSQRDRWLNRLDCLISHTKKGWTLHDQPLVVYLGLKHARALVVNCEEFWNAPDDFYIRHADTHGGNVMAEAGEITALIDWEW